MIRHGEAPYLECSSKGDKRFSAFYAKVMYNGQMRSIEDHYQAAKVFEDGSTGLDWRKAKGKKAVNMQEVAELYSILWNLYILQHPELWDTLANATGTSDMFGQPNHQCQATELWRIRGELLEYLNQKGNR